MIHLEVLAGVTFDLQAFIWLNAGAIIVLIIFSALFSGSETALTSASRGKLKTQAEKGNKGAQRALIITDDRETLISSVLVGNNLVNILATALATNLFTLLFGDSGVLITTIVMTMVVLIFAEVLPKTYAIARPEEASQKASRFILPFIFIFTPIVVVIKALVTAFLRLLGLLEPRSESLEDVQDEIKGRIELEIPTGMFDKEDQRRVLGALDISSLSVEDVMRHRSEIDMLNADDPIEEILAQCMTTPHSRLPVYKDETENIIKIAHVKDLYRNYWGQNEKIETSTPLGEHWYTNLKEPYFVIETTPLGILMQEFLEKRTHFALVVDEYGALQGLVTLEDIIEEIVGEIEDEYDQEQSEPFKEVSQGVYLVDGALPVREFNKMLNLDLPDDQAVTLAGLVINEIKYIPVKGENFDILGYRFEIVDRIRNRVTQIRIQKIAETENS